MISEVFKLNSSSLLAVKLWIRTIVSFKRFSPASTFIDKELALFSTDSETHLAWFQPASLVPLYKFQLFGIIFALAVYNGVTLPVSFPLAFYRKLLGLECNATDIDEGWPSQAKSLRDLCNYKGSVEDDLARDFTFSFTANGLYVETDMTDPWLDSHTSSDTSKDVRPGTLKIYRSYPDRHHPEREARKTHQTNATEVEALDKSADSQGSTNTFEFDSQAFCWPGWKVEVVTSTETITPVTNTNREEYANLYAQWLLDYSIRPQFEAFAKGFNTVLGGRASKVRPHWKLLYSIC